MSQSIAKGTTYLIVAQVLFIGVSYATQVSLAWLLGPALYGVLGTLLSLYIINRTILQTSIPTALSRFIAAAKEEKKAIFRAGLKLQGIVSVIFSIPLLAFSKQIAFILNDPSLQPYIMFVGLMIVPRALFALLLNGLTNGLKRFKLQAITSLFHGVLQAIISIGLVALGWGLFGALSGYLISIVIIVIILSWYLKEYWKVTTNFPIKKISYFAAPLAVIALCTATIRNINPLLLKYFLFDNATIGIYTAAATISSIPYLALSMSLPAALLPTITKAKTEGKEKEVSKYIQKSTRYLLLVLIPLTTLIATTSKPLLSLLYPVAYKEGAAVLSILIIGVSFLVLFTLFSSILIALNKPVISMSALLGGITLMLTSSFVLIPMLGTLGAAYALLIGTTCAAIITIIYLVKKYHIISVHSLINILVSSSIVYILSYFWQPKGILLVVSYGVIGLCYLLMLFLLKEVTQKDITFLKKLIRK